MFTINTQWGRGALIALWGRIRLRSGPEEYPPLKCSPYIYLGVTPFTGTRVLPLAGIGAHTPPPTGWDWGTPSKTGQAKDRIDLCCGRCASCVFTQDFLKNVVRVFFFGGGGLPILNYSLIKFKES